MGDSRKGSVVDKLRSLVGGKQRERNPTRRHLPTISASTQQKLRQAGLGAARLMPVARERAPLRRRSQMTREELREQQKVIMRKQAIRREKRTLAKADGEREQRRRAEKNLRWHEERRKSQLRAERSVLYFEQVFDAASVHPSMAGMVVEVPTTDPERVHPAFHGRVAVKRPVLLAASNAGAAVAPKYAAARFHPALRGFHALASAADTVAPLFFGKLVTARDWDQPLEHPQDPGHFSSKLVAAGGRINAYKAVGTELEADARRDVFEVMSAEEQRWLVRLKERIEEGPCFVCHGEEAGRGCPGCFVGSSGKLRSEDGGVDGMTPQQRTWSYMHWRGAVINHRQAFTCPLRIMVRSLPSGEMVYLNVDATDSVARLFELFRCNSPAFALSADDLTLMLPTSRGLFRLRPREDLTLADWYLRTRGARHVLVHALHARSALGLINHFIEHNVVELRGLQLQRVEEAVDGGLLWEQPEADSWLAADPLQVALFSALERLAAAAREFALEEARMDAELQHELRIKAFVEKRKRDIEQKRKIVARRKKLKVIEQAWEVVNGVRGSTLEGERLMQAWFNAWQSVKREIGLGAQVGAEVYDTIFGEAELAMADMLGLASSTLPFRVVALVSGLIMFHIGDLTTNFVDDDEGAAVRRVYGLSLADMPGVLAGERGEHELDVLWDRGSEMTSVAQLLEHPFVNVPWQELALALQRSLPIVFHLKLHLDTFDTALHSYRNAKATRYFDSEELHDWRKGLQRVLAYRDVGMIADEAKKLLAVVMTRIELKGQRVMVVKRS